MRSIPRSLVLLIATAGLGGGTLPATAQKSLADTRVSGDIAQLLQRQAADWNRGDLDAFATGYKDSADILFIGKTLEHGYGGMLAGYKHRYPTRESMGTLGFSMIAVQPLDARFATCTGHFHLERTPAGGGDADGYFLLVLEKTAKGWKIIRDDTTGLPSGR